jgi:hypothetical protein
LGEKGKEGKDKKSSREINKKVRKEEEIRRGER